jgi:hypothetical protein
LSFVLSDNNQRSLDQLAKEFDKWVFKPIDYVKTFFVFRSATDLRLTLFNFTGFGKEFIKANKISPGLYQLKLLIALNIVLSLFVRHTRTFFNPPKMQKTLSSRKGLPSFFVPLY